MPAVLPPLLPWSKTAHNRCEYDDIVSHWMARDALTFLVDLEVYCPDLYALLTDAETEQALRSKPEISRQRFVVSRAILKRILSEILQEENAADIVLTRNADGRVLVQNRPDVFICLSYHETSIAITVGRRKIGSDIEGVRPVRDRKITASSIFQLYSCSPGEEHVQQVIHVWTLVESYAKLHDTNPYPLLNTCIPFKDAGFVSYSIDDRLIFTLASALGHMAEILVWLDI